MTDPGTYHIRLGGDNSACDNSRCPSRETCLRYMGMRNLWRQVYSDFQHDKSGKCEAYWPIEENK